MALRRQTQDIRFDFERRASMTVNLSCDYAKVGGGRERFLLFILLLEVRSPPLPPAQLFACRIK